MNRVEITIVRQRRDDLTGDWNDTPTEHTIPGVIVAPTGSTEASDRAEIGDQVTTRRDLYVPDARPDQLDVTATDRIRLPGETGAPRWQVAGDVAGWSSPHTDWTAGAVIRVERTTG